MSTEVAAGLGELSVAAFLGEVLAMVPEDTDDYLILADREREALEQTGSIAAAAARATTMLDLAQRRIDADPDGGAPRTPNRRHHHRHHPLQRRTFRDRGSGRRRPPVGRRDQGLHRITPTRGRVVRRYGASTSSARAASPPRRTE